MPAGFLSGSLGTTPIYSDCWGPARRIGPVGVSRIFAANGMPTKGSLLILALTLSCSTAPLVARQDFSISRSERSVTTTVVGPSVSARLLPSLALLGRSCRAVPRLGDV